MTYNDKMKIIEWLYLHDHGFPNAREWRKALIEFLDELLKNNE